MKITVEVSDSELREIRALTRERKKGPAIRKLLAEAIRLKTRHALSDRIMAGEAGLDLPGTAKLREDRRLW